MLPLWRALLCSSDRLYDETHPPLTSIAAATASPALPVHIVHHATIDRAHAHELRSRQRARVCVCLPAPPSLPSAPLPSPPLPFPSLPQACPSTHTCCSCQYAAISAADASLLLPLRPRLRLASSAAGGSKRPEVGSAAFVCGYAHGPPALLRSDRHLTWFVGRSLGPSMSISIGVHSTAWNLKWTRKLDANGNAVKRSFDGRNEAPNATADQRHRQNEGRRQVGRGVGIQHWIIACIMFIRMRSTHHSRVSQGHPSTEARHALRCAGGN